MNAISTQTQPQTTIWNESQLDLLKRTICNGATDDEFRLFVQVAQHSGLDPFARQVHGVKRYDSKLGREVMTIQTSVDGFRLIAQRTKQYRGQTKPEWCGPDGVWREVWLEDAPPAAARIGVYRDGFPEPLYGIARWKSFAQTGKNGLMPLWAKLPDVMLLKCAECQALRKAFPQEMLGLYADEEMPSEPVQRVKETTTGETVTRKPKWEDDQKKEGGELRAWFMAIGGEGWFGAHLKRMAYDEPKSVLAYFRERKAKWIPDQVDAAKGTVVSIAAAGLDKALEADSVKWDFADPLAVYDNLCALLRTVEG